MSVTQASTHAGTPHLTADDHTWQLRDVQYEDAVTTRGFECVGCGAVRYE
jgi:hypothetical protein